MLLIEDHFGELFAVSDPKSLKMAFLIWRRAAVVSWDLETDGTFHSASSPRCNDTNDCHSLD